MKSTALKFAVLVFFTVVLIGCASQSPMAPTTTTQTTKGPLERGNGLTSVMH